MEKAKTCEEYVLRELAEAKRDAKAGAKMLKNALSMLDGKNELLGVFREKLERRNLPDGTRVIAMKPVFSTFDREEFEMLEAFLEERTGDD